MTVRLVRGDRDRPHRPHRRASTSLYIDLEHSSFSLETTGQICIAALEVGIAPFVRVPANHAGLHLARPRRRRARRDRAAHPARPRRRARWSRRPNSRRSASAPTPAACRTCSTARFPAAEVYAALNDATMVIVQFESAEALETHGRDRRGRGRRHGPHRASTTCWPTGAFPANTTIRACATPMRGPSRRAAGTASTPASAGSPVAPDLMAEYVKMGARYVSTGTDLQLPARRLHASGRSRCAKSSSEGAKGFQRTGHAATSGGSRPTALILASAGYRRSAVQLIDEPDDARQVGLRLERPVREETLSGKTMFAAAASEGRCWRWRPPRRPRTTRRSRCG